MALNDQLPKYLLEKSQLVSTVTFTALFSIVFMLMSIPFSHNAWFELGTGSAFGLTIAFFAISLLIVIFSKTVMYRSRTNLNMTMLGYILWNTAEGIAICLLYTFFTVGGEQLGFLDLRSETPVHVFMSSLAYMVISLGIPYVLAAMYFAINDKNNTIRLMNFGSVVSDSEPLPQDRQRITLFDNSGVLKLSVSSSNLLYIESDDNYIKVWYSDSQKEIKQYMLRCRLKTVEESFAGSDLTRCHRKYMVNMSKVKVLSKEKDGYYLDMGLKETEPIPVSKTYEETILSKFNSR